MENYKKRVIIFGINNVMRGRIEHWLDDDVDIVGYADYGKDFQNCREFAYKPLFSMSDLKEKDDLYDYIIICETDYKKWEQKSGNLINAGCKAEKILPTLMLKYPTERLFVSPLDDFIEMSRDFYGLCFGMSYSKSAFMEHYFADDWFKFSTSGSDLHTHDSWLTYLLTCHAELMKPVKKIILELPYYILTGIYRAQIRFTIEWCNLIG